MFFIICLSLQVEKIFKNADNKEEFEKQEVVSQWQGTPIDKIVYHWNLLLCSFVPPLSYFHYNLDNYAYIDSEIRAFH